MKFFIAFAVIAFAAVVLAVDIDDEPAQLALWESDSVETGRLVGDRKLFADFCISSRDSVKAYMNQRMGENAAKFYTALADTISEVAKTVGEAYTTSVRENSQSLSSGSINLPTAITMLSKIVSSTATSQIGDKVAELKELINADNLKVRAEDVCRDITMYLKPSIESQFREYKKSLPQGVDISSIRLNNVGCVTTGRLTKVASACNLFHTMGGTLMEFLGY